MIDVDGRADQLRAALARQADPTFVDGLQRYFPQEVVAIGVPNAEVAGIADRFVRDRPDLEPGDRLLLADELVLGAAHHEEVLLGFALLHKVARRGLGEELLDHARTWLEEAVTNWAQCDDLCLKLLYPFFLGHLDLIPRTQEWLHLDSPWARRAANVAVVKFVRRKVGRTIYELPVEHVLDNCTRLMHDEDDYVQKGCGWLLKVTAGVHPEEVADFLSRWHAEMSRPTFRYAVEKMEPARRAELMALGSGAER